MAPSSPPNPDPKLMDPLEEHGQLPLEEEERKCVEALVEASASVLKAALIGSGDSGGLLPGLEDLAHARDTLQKALGRGWTPPYSLSSTLPC